MKDCVFCKIINGELPATIYKETNDLLIFSPIDVVNEGHLLIIPKSHYVDIFDTPEDLLCSIMKIAKEISLEVIGSTDATGVNILHASGVDAQQSVGHFHLHLVPRYSGDGLDLWIKQGL